MWMRLPQAGGRRVPERPGKSLPGKSAGKVSREQRPEKSGRPDGREGRGQCAACSLFLRPSCDLFATFLRPSCVRLASVCAPWKPANQGIEPDGTTPAGGSPVMAPRPVPQEPSGVAVWPWFTEKSSCGNMLACEYWHMPIYNILLLGYAYICIALYKDIEL